MPYLNVALLSEGAYNEDRKAHGPEKCICLSLENGNRNVAMLTQSRDTHPEAERVQIELLRKTPPERRLELGLTFCEEGLAIAHHAIAQANPLLSEQEQKLLFVEITYGKDLADRIRAYLARKE